MYESYLRRMLGSSHPVSIKAECAAALKWFPAVHTSSDGDCRDIQVPGTLGVVAVSYTHLTLPTTPYV